jgi:hypothetical protein
MTWQSEALKFVSSGAVGGVFGASVTYGLTWIRERRRTLDAYRSPQRQAIGEILTATHAFMMRELEKRTVMTELVNQMRQKEHFDPPGQELAAAEVAMGNALLGLDRALAIGTLTIIDAPCWEAMGAAYFEFDQLRSAIKGGATEKQTLEEIEQYIETIAEHASRFNDDVSALVRAAQDRVSPAETFSNPWRRRRARGRLGKLYQQMNAVDTPDEGSPEFAN